MSASSRLRNSRVGVDPRAPLAPASSSPHQLPPIAARHTPHAQLQQQELRLLRDAFRERLRANRKLGAFASLQPLEAAIGELNRRRGAEELEEEEEEEEEEDSVAFVARLALALEPSAPLAARFVASLVDSIRALVHAKLRAEAAEALVSPACGSPRPRQQRSGAGDLGEHDEPLSSSSSSENESEAESDDVDEESDALADESRAADSAGDPHEAQDGVVPSSSRVVDAPRGNTFRTSRRSRRFPPSRVPTAEHIVETCTYTPFDHSTAPGDLASIRLARAEGGSSSSSSAEQWLVVQFPRPKPKMSRPETDALVRWACSKFAALASDPPSAPETYAARVQRFHRALALFELVCFEATRLVFDKCPTTARFVHGLFVELVDTALRTVANADREAQIDDQRHKNVQQELQRLAVKLEAVRSSLASLEETLTKRQRHLLSERERIIRQRKKLNLLLCADQVLIRNVAGLIQHLLDLADELATAVAVDDPHGLLGGQSAKHVFVGDGVDGTPRFAAVDELYELVKSKYASLRGVERAIARVEKAHKDADDLEAETAAAALAQDERIRTDQVIILDLDKVATATEDFKSALRRLNRLVSTKSPDSIVGWEAQELWDQALFIPPHEDIQDLDRDVLRLCRYVEANILRQRHQVRELRRHASVQTDISSCVSFRQRGRANGLAISFAPEHRELLEKFLPPAFRRFVHGIPSDYSPRQLSLGVIHSIISYLFNEMWLLVREEYLLQPRRFSITAATTSSSVPVASIHEYVYRIYLLHFREPAFVTSRLLDLLVSASRLDTQSCKVLLFCRLLNLPGVDPLPQDAFWFVLKTMHILQRACASTGNYFHLDASGENEFIPQASATEALNILFRGATNDVMKRLRLRLAGLASVYGTIWIPAPNIIEFVTEEWRTAQDSLRMSVMEHIVQEQKAASAVPDNHLPTFAAFLRVFSELHLKVHRVEAAQAYRQLLSSATQTKKHSGGDVAEAFTQKWLQLVLHAVNQVQQQQHTPSAQHHSSGGAGGKSAGSSTGIHFGLPSDALVSASRHLSFCFLKATWQQTKNDFIRSLDVKFHDIGLQVRLIQQMDHIVAHEDLAAQVGWSSLQQLIEITSTGKVAPYY